MGSYLKSEHLKYKRTFCKKLVIIAPVTVALLAFLMGGFYWYQSLLLYWWYAFILSGALALICSLANHREGGKAKYAHIFSQPINIKRFWISKNLMVMYLFGLMQIMLLLLGNIPYVISPSTVQFHLGVLFLGVCMIFITEIWQIPLCMFLSKKFGLYVAIIVNVLLGLISPIIFKSSIISWIVPYCWAAKALQYSLGIKVSGDLMEFPGIKHIVNVVILCMLSIVLFLVLLKVTAKWFENSGDN